MAYTSTNTIGLRVEVLRSGGVYTTLEPHTPPEIQNSGDSALKMSLRGTFLVPEKEVHWLTDRLRPVLIINGTEYPVGMYVPTTPSWAAEGGKTVLTVEGYSLLYLADRVKMEPGYTIAAGTNYIAAVQELLQTAGITRYLAEETALTLATDRADWDTGTTVLDVVNQLLSEINYNSAWVDLSGQVRLTKYRVPTAADIQHIYNPGAYSVISADTSTTTDYFDKANVFRAVCSSPDLSEPLTAEAENDDPDSSFSTASLGVRIVETVMVDSVPDLDTLQETADNMLTKSLQTTETIVFSTALMPVHETHDVVALGLDGVGGIWRETGWRMVLDASGDMEHTAERVVIR